MASETWEQDKINMLLLSNEEAHKVTVESIELALLYLMKEEPYDKITVSGIVKRAGVSRAAFYKNYKSKEEVLQSLLDGVSAEIEKTMQAVLDQPQYIFWTAMFENLKENGDLYISMCENGLQVFLQSHFNNLSMKYMDALEDQNKYYMLFYAGAVSNVVIGWLSAGAKESPEEMGRVLEEMIG